jgi:hypothetical protein
MDENPETQSESLEEMPIPAKKSRRSLWVILGVGLVFLLAAAAFLAGRFLQNGPAGFGKGMFLSPNRSEGRAVHQIFSKNDIIPAPDLPKAAADATGVFLHRQNNSFFIGTGNVNIHVGGGGPNGASQVSSSYDGPEIEVVVTNNTKVYRDDTFQNEPDLPSGSKIQQKVVPGSLDEIGQASMINAWGKQTGDRLVADLLLYNNN